MQLNSKKVMRFNLAICFFLFHSQFVQLGEGLNDNRWHTLHIKRRADHLEIWVDDGLHDVCKCDGCLSDKVLANIFLEEM